MSATVGEGGEGPLRRRVGEVERGDARRQAPGLGPSAAHPPAPRGCGVGKEGGSEGRWAAHKPAEAVGKERVGLCGEAHGKLCLLDWLGPSLRSPGK